MEKEHFEYEFVAQKKNWLGKTKYDKTDCMDSRVCGEILFSCRDVKKSYGSQKALSGVSLEISRGKIIGLLGPNGSGKTTLMKLASGLLTLDSGEVRVLKNQIGVETKKHVAYLPERCSLPRHFTVGEAIGFYEDFFEDFDRALAEKMLGDLSLDSKKKIKSLSKGEREKVALILVMSRRADLYILDEPISGVDPAARDYIIDTIIKNIPDNSSVLISTHLISDVEKIMDEFIFMKYGEIYTRSTPGEIRQTYGKSVDEYFREVFRC